MPDLITTTAQRFAFLTHATTELLNSTHPRAVINDLCTRVLPLVHADLFLNYLLDPVSHRLHLNTHGGIPQDLAAANEWLDLGAAVCGSVAQAGQPAILDHVQSTSSPRECFIRDLGVHAYASFPLIAGGKTLGVLSFGSRRFSSFHPDDVALLHATADHIALALHRLAQDDALRTSEQRRLLALQATQDGIWDFNPATGEYFWSDRLLEMLGYDSHELPHTLDTINSILMHPDDLLPTWDAVNRYLRRETDTYELRFRLRHKDGSYRWILSRAIALFDAQGTPLRLVGAHTDITDSRRAADALKEAHDAAAAANRAKDHFLAVLSHELRTPLTPVLAAAQALERDPHLPPDLTDLASTIRRNVELETRLIDDLLDLTRITKGKLELVLATVDLHNKIKNVLHIVDVDLRAKHLTLHLDLAAPRHHVRGDAGRLQQVLWNLLKNAIKFTPDGGSISLRTTSDDRHIHVHLTDTGVGIDPAALPSLFHPFEQGGRHVTRHFGGLGLGLAIAKSLVDLHGGAIAATSPGPNKGATFSFELPLVPAPAPADPAHPLPDTSTGKPRPLRILLVEDNPDTLRVMARLLTADGHTLTTASTVANAKSILNNASFDLLLSDIGLPDGSGLDLLSSPRRPPHAIALSGYGMDEDLARSKAAGFDAHLTKPINLHLLEQTLRTL